MKKLFRIFGFYTRWEVLDAMIPGKWYYGLNLVKEHGFSRSGVYGKLSQLQDEGFVERRQVRDDMRLPPRSQFRRTGKRSPQENRERHAVPQH